MFKFSARNPVLSPPSLPVHLERQQRKLLTNSGGGQSVKTVQGPDISIVDGVISWNLLTTLSFFTALAIFIIGAGIEAPEVKWRRITNVSGAN